MLTLPPGEGVLPNRYLRDAIGEAVVADDDIPKENVQPASIDLRLGTRAYRIRCSFLPDAEPVEKKLEPLILNELDLTGDGALLEPGNPYLIVLKESLQLPDTVRAKANPKSSTGRADVFTRVITDKSSRFDEITAGYHGRLYLEVVPLSFPVRVREDLTLNQVRLSVGRSELTDGEILEYHRHHPLLHRAGAPVPPEQLQLSNGMFLGLDLRGRKGHVGYRAQEHPPVLDLTRDRRVAPDSYWELVRSDARHRVVLSPRKFYLLMSNEAVSIPPDLAAEMTAYDPTSGELRTHYAGFFDPGFGYDREGRFHGSRAALEVRAHDVPFMIEDGQPVCKLTFERMLAEPDAVYGDSGARSNYQRQQDALGKHFIPYEQSTTPSADELPFPPGGEREAE